MPGQASVIACRSTLVEAAPESRRSVKTSMMPCSSYCAARADGRAQWPRADHGLFRRCDEREQVWSQFVRGKAHTHVGCVARRSRSVGSCPGSGGCFRPDRRSRRGRSVPALWEGLDGKESGCRAREKAASPRRHPRSCTPPPLRREGAAPEPELNGPRWWQGRPVVVAVLEAAPQERDQVPRQAVLGSEPLGSRRRSRTIGSPRSA